MEILEVLELITAVIKIRSESDSNGMEDKIHKKKIR